MVYNAPHSDAELDKNMLKNKWLSKEAGFRLS